MAADKKKKGARQTEGINLRVAEAHAKDVGRGVARIDPADMESLGVAIGDVVSISGKGEAVAKLMPTYMEERGKKLIQIDGVLRDNAKTGIGEKVGVTKAACTDAQKIVLKPLQTGLGREGEEDYLGRLLDGLPTQKGNTVRAVLFGSRSRDFEVLDTNPRGPVLITSRTNVSVKGAPARDVERGPLEISYEDIGGLEKEIQRIREMIELPLKYPQVFDRLGIDAPKGVLLHGPPGTGKTLIARAVAHEAEANFYTINGPEIVHKFYGESEQALREYFEKASSTSPSIIFIDELDAIAPKRTEVQGEVEKRIVATLLAQMDGLKSRGQIIVIGATNIPEVIDPALRRPGRFDREIRVGIPDRNGREQILDIHTRGMPLAEGVDIERMAEITHGYVGADLEALAREAAMCCLREVLGKAGVSLDEIPLETFLEVEVTQDHFTEALKEVEPSAIREVFVEIPNVTWQDVGGLDDVKRILKEAVQWPLSFAPLFEQAKATPPKGILLKGPPGTGKTLIAKALANESGVNFISIKGPEMMSKWVGEAEKAVRQVFQRAKAASPCIIFFDELDSIVPQRGADGDSGVTQRVLSQFLTELDGIEELKGVVVLGATNRPDIIDPALLRTGRFDFILSVPKPDSATRRKIFEVHTRGRPLVPGVDIKAFVKRTDGMVGSDIEAICRRATMVAVREFIDEHKETANAKKEALKITPKHFESAFAEVEKEG